MARPQSGKVRDVLDKLRTRLREGVHRPGDRFLSAREVATTLGVSYQTAHRLVRALCDEGLLERRPGAGTFLPGGQTPLTDVQLFFSARARRAGSFGARLLRELTRRLDRDRVAWETCWDDEAPDVDGACFPVIWEFPDALALCRQTRRSALLLNDRPRPGLDAGFLDSVAVDDFAGGVFAGELLGRDLAPGASAALAVMSGPPGDARSRERVGGFLHVHPGAAAIVPAGSWFFEDGYAVAGEAVRLGPDGVFCANDRLAQAVAAFCARERAACPRLVGFDDAPVAESLNLTTIAIPWDEVIADALEIIRRRLNGDRSAARHLIVTPRPVVRRL